MNLPSCPAFLRRLLGVSAILASFVLLASPIGAQLPPGKWWKNPEVIRDLGLAKPQIEKLETLFAAVRPKLIDMTAEVQKIELDLEASIEHSPFDEKKAAALADRLSEARCRVMGTEMSMMLGARAILTDEQYVLLRAGAERRRGEPPPGPGRPDPERPPHRRGDDRPPGEPPFGAPPPPGGGRPGGR